MLERIFVSSEEGMVCENKQCEYIPHFKPPKTLAIIKKDDITVIKNYADNKKVVIRKQNNYRQIEVYEKNGLKLLARIFPNKIIYRRKNYTLDDFLQMSEDERLERILTLINHPVRGFLVPWILYHHGPLTYIEIGDIAIKSFDENIVPQSEPTYRSYLDDSIKGAGLLTRLNLVVKDKGYIKGGKKIRSEDFYELSSFGEYFVKRMGYFIELFLKYNVNPMLFGQAASPGKIRAPLARYKILKYLYKHEKSNMEEIAKNLQLSSNPVERALNDLEEEGLIEIIGGRRRGYVFYEATDKIYKEDIDAIINKIKRKIGHRKDVIRNFVEFIRQSKTFRMEDIAKSIPYGSTPSLISAAKELGYIKGQGVTIVRLTEKGRKFFEELEDIINKFFNKQLREYIPSKTQIEELLERFYSERLERRRKSKTLDIIVGIVYSVPGLTYYDIRRLTNIPTGTIIQYIRCSSLFKRERKGETVRIYPADEQLRNLLENPGKDLNEVKDLVKKYRNLFYVIDGKVYPKKYIFLFDEKDKVKEIYVVTERAYKDLQSFSDTLKPFRDFLLDKKLYVEKKINDKIRKVIKYLIDKEYIKRWK